MKLLLITSLLLTLCLYAPLYAVKQASGNSAAAVTVTAVDTVKSLSDCYNELNTLIRDGRIPREEAALELKRLLGEIHQQYYLRGGKDYPRSAWVFPLAGYDSSAIDNGRRHGYSAKGYDFFSGNRHGGHPSFDIFIRDRNQDMLDDRSGRAVEVLSMTGGIVVAVEKNWEYGSRLRGGNYIWVYDPATEKLLYYAHNNQLLVNPGDMVKPGDRMATVGRSGFNAAKRRSPTHLHLTVLRVIGGRPRPLDIYEWLRMARTLDTTS